MPPGRCRRLSPAPQDCHHRRMRHDDDYAADAPADAGPGLIGGLDPPAYTFLPGASARALLLCDHASAAVPASLAQLGLPPSEFARHIAVDLHAAVVTRALAARLGLPAFLHGYSRLVADANRAYDDPTLCPAVSDGTLVPGNRDLGEAARRQRWREIHQPYHRAISAWLHARMADGESPALISIHSFAPELGGVRRRWPIAALWNEDGRMALPFMRALRELDGVDVGDNEPYSGRVGFGYTMAEHAEACGLPHLLIELRQDVLDDEAQRAHWIDLIARRLAPMLEDPSLYRRFDPAMD
jgi:predicted N-formylglutamate amidohydrolase